MSNDISVSSVKVSPSIASVASVSPPVRLKAVTADTSDAALIAQSANAAVFNIQTTGELKKAELSGDHLTLGDVQMIKAIERANKALEGRSTTFEFSIHQKTKLISIKVLDKETGETIREIPPEKTLDMVAKMWEMAGLLVDERR